MSAIQFKRGDTFKMVGTVKTDGTVKPMTGYTIKAQIRRKGIRETSGFISELDGTWVNAALASIQILDATTIDWPLGAAELDIRLTAPDTMVTTTVTREIEIIEAITRD